MEMERAHSCENLPSGVNSSHLLQLSTNWFSEEIVNNRRVTISLSLTSDWMALTANRLPQYTKVSKYDYMKTRPRPTQPKTYVFPGVAHY